MRINYLDILLTKNEKCVIAEFTISCRKGTETNSEKVLSKFKQKREKSAQILVGEPG